MSKREYPQDKLKLEIMNCLSKFSDAFSIKIAQELFISILRDNSNSENNLIYVISMISEKIKINSKDERKELIKLLPVFINEVNRISVFLPKVLTILQFLIKEENSKIYNLISENFGEIIRLSWEKIKTDEDRKTQFELFQSMCFFNLKQENKASQICGSLCLSRLIESFPYVVNNPYMKTIYENIFIYLEKPNFSAKSELLDCLINLIFAAQSLFKPYSTVTLYKILDYLTDQDYVKRKLAVDVILILANYCYDEIITLKDQIIEFLRVLKSDKAKQVREACLNTLKFLNDEELTEEDEFLIKNPINEENDESDSKISKGKHSNNEVSIDPENYSSRNTQNSRQTEPKKKIQKSSEKTLKRDKNMVKNSSLINESNPRIPFENNLENDKKKQTLEFSKNISKEIKKREAKTPDIGRRTNNSITEPELNTNSDRRNVGLNDYQIKNPKKDAEFTNKKEKITNNNQMVDSPMKLKKNLKSAFQGPKNSDFFKNAARNEIQILVSDRREYGTNDENLDPIEEFKENIKSNNYNRQKEIEIEDIDEDEEKVIERNRNELVEKGKLSKIKNQKETNIKVSNSQIQNDVYGSVETFSGKNKNDYNLSPKFAVSNEKNIKQNEQKKGDNFKEAEFLEKCENIFLTKKENAEILKQMKDISEKQIILIDTLENMQKVSNEQFNSINSRLSKVESIVYKYLINQENSKIIFDNENQNNKSFDSLTLDINKEKFNLKNNTDKLNDSSWSEITHQIRRNNYNEAFSIALTKENIVLIKLIESMNIINVLDLSSEIFEELIIKLTYFLLKSEFISQTLKFMKGIITTKLILFKKTIILNLKDALKYLMNNQMLNKSEEDYQNAVLIQKEIENKIENLEKENNQKNTSLNESQEAIKQVYKKSNLNKFK